MQGNCTTTTEDRTMTDSQQSQRGWFSTWREHRDAKRRQVLEGEQVDAEHASETGGWMRRSSGYGHGAGFFGSGFGGDGGGCGGDGGGGGC